MVYSNEVFTSYDIRGVYEKELTNDLAYLVGKGFGSLSNGVVIVGHDARTSSNALNTNLIKGLLETGTKVIDIGLVTTPMLYYARELLGYPYAVMITASHCSKEYNGFKLCDEEGTLFGEKIQNLLNIIEKQEFKSGMGSIDSVDVTYDYKKMLYDKIKLGERRLKIVVDCGNGTTSFYNPEIISNWGVEVIPLYCESDPTFPNHIPDPSVHLNMIDLQKKVKEEQADLGIAFDGDGDRIGIVDEKGDLIKSDLLMIFLWKSIEKHVKNKVASFDVSCSNALKEALLDMGFITRYNKIGHSFLKHAVKENNYDFAGEISGHFCFNDDFYGYDDALYAAGRILKIISNDEKNLSDYFLDIPKYFSTDIEYIDVEEEKKDKIVNKIKNHAVAKGYKIVTVDGVRIEFEDGFALVRKSNTSSSIMVRFEGHTKEIMEKYRLEILSLINEEL